MKKLTSVFLMVVLCVSMGLGMVSCASQNAAPADNNVADKNGTLENMCWDPTGETCEW